MFETVIYGYGVSKAVEWGLSILGVGAKADGGAGVPVERAPHPNVDPSAVSYVDHRGLRCFYPSVRLEILTALRGSRAFPVDPLGLVVSLAPDPFGRPIPVEETAETWARERNESAMILAPYYIQHNIAARRFLRACPRSQARLYASNGNLYVVLCEVGQAARLDTRAPPKPHAKVATPPTMVVPDLRSAIVARDPSEATPEEIKHEHPLPPPANNAAAE